MRLALWLFPAILWGGQARYARLGEFEGKVEVQLQAADRWLPAETQPAAGGVDVGAHGRVLAARSGAGRRQRVRLEPDSRARSPIHPGAFTRRRSRLLFAWIMAVAYFTGEPRNNDSLSLAVPARRYLHSRRAHSPGKPRNAEHRHRYRSKVRYSSATAEIDLVAGRRFRLEPENTARFFWNREVKAMDPDH